MRSRDRFLAAFSGADVDRPPLWLMRQAGRYLPGYRALRARHAFWEVCKDPALSTEAALEPIRLFDLDAAIVFSDILVVPDALGLGVQFTTGEGPVLQYPVRCTDDLERLDARAARAKLSFVPAAVRHLRAAIGEDRALLGFAGAPWTLFAYAVEGQSSDDFRRARLMLQRDSVLAGRAMALFADVTIELLLAQLEAGADAVQLFDTWAGLLSAHDYARFVAPHVARICAAVQSAGGRLLLFVRGGAHLMPELARLPADGLSLDWRVDWREARRLCPDRVLQGHLDPVVLLGDDAGIIAAAQRVLADMTASSGARRCIFNLGHGVLPETEMRAVETLVKTWKTWSS